MAKCGIPPQNRKAAEDKALAAAEHTNWRDKAQRQAFFLVKLPEIVQAEQA
jgi:hypothetical protein